MVNKFLTTEVDGITILVEATMLPGTEKTAGRNDTTNRIKDLLITAQTAIEHIANTTAQAAKRIGTRSLRPNQLEVEFGIKFSTEGHIIFARAASEASLNIKVIYTNTE